MGPAEPAATLEVGGLLVARHYGDPAAEYAAALQGVVAVLRPHEGRLRAVGRDRLDLIHRMSTNDVASLQPGQARHTVLTTPVARIVDLLWVLNLGESVLCVTSPGRAEPVRRWLGGHVFYNDQVKFQDASAELGQLALFGPGAAAVAESLLHGAAELAEDRLIERGGLLAVRGRPLAGGGFTLLAPAEQLPGLWQAALDAGAAPAGEDAYQMLRIRAGQPHGGRELTEEYIPLEANLWPAVSFTKGCYIGQEIIARMESRGKLARRLCGLKLESPAEPGAEVRAQPAAAQPTATDTVPGARPAPLGALLGAVTSAAILPDLGPMALAYLKTAAAEPGTTVHVNGVPAVVVELPFAAGLPGQSRSQTPRATCQVCCLITRPCLPPTNPGWSFHSNRRPRQSGAPSAKSPPQSAAGSAG